MLTGLTEFLKERLIRPVQRGPGCQVCGLCCEAFGGMLRASEADIDRWQAAGRRDILAYVGETRWLWLDPQSGQRLSTCPFLTRNEDDQALCAIHAVKPDICRAYPTEAAGRCCARGIYFPPPSLWSRDGSDLH